MDDLKQPYEELFLVALNRAEKAYEWKLESHIKSINEATTNYLTKFRQLIEVERHNIETRYDLLLREYEKMLGELKKEVKAAKSTATRMTTLAKKAGYLD